MVEPSKAHEPTIEQDAILNYTGNCAVVAKPGSGKTFTLAEKIRIILPNLPHFKGVIAISFTNKASNELQRRALQGGVNRKGSFFGTIDRFLLSEIIRPFGPRVFGEPNGEVAIIAKINELEADEREDFRSVDYSAQVNSVEMTIAGQLFARGRIFLPAAGAMASHILRNSAAARRYLRARYTHIFIDEYQDCGYWQHRLFVGLVKSGLIGIAVGDVDQSIYVFAKKDPRYLHSLLKMTEFKTFALSKSHRSPQSIVDYSTKLLSPSYQPLEKVDSRVALACIDGNESDIGLWLNAAIPKVMQEWEVRDHNRVAILVRSSRTAALVAKTLTIPYYYREDTQLDYDVTLWGVLFRRLLSWLFSGEQTKYEIVESYLDIFDRPTLAKKIMTDLRDLEEMAKTDRSTLIGDIQRFERIAQALLPNSRMTSALQALEAVLKDPNALASFAVAGASEVHMMTMHKSKGLEFDIVFHLDLYEHIMPMFNGDLQQELNLHYVAITRARKYCVLCTSTKRTDFRGDVKGARHSPFLELNDVQRLRVDFGVTRSSHNKPSPPALNPA